MDADEFWQLTSSIDQAALAAGEEERAIEPLLEELARLPEAEIQGYEQLLAEFLYDLDGEEYADNAGESGRSDDGFLYSRCYVVARGRAFYENVLGNPVAMPKSIDQWCEPLLFATAQAWAMATGRDAEEWDYKASRSYETGSNTKLWNPSQYTVELNAPTEQAFNEPNYQRAVARAGHAFRAKQYKNVVLLLEQHENQLSKKLLRMLNVARVSLE